MTWTEEEITGHLWNPGLDVDDDGEGINGIGFRPTTAIEWKRRQGRKRQISDWKAREANEDRRRRIERRKKGAVESAPGGSQASDGIRDAVCTDGNAGQETQEGKRARVRFAQVA